MVYREASAAAVNAPRTGRVRFESAVPQARIIDRVAYVASFARRAQDAGAAYLLGQRVLSIQPEADGVTVVTNEGSHRSRAVVLAAGFGSPLTRQLGMGAVSDYVTGAQAVVSTKDVSEVEVHLSRDVAPGRALAGLLVRRQARAHLDRFIEGQQRHGKIASVIHHSARWGVPLRPLRRTYRDRVLVVGDAAGQVKPTTGGGIFYALLASKIVSQTLAEALADDDLSATRLSRYQSRWKDLLTQELEVGYSARRLFESLFVRVS